MTPACHAAEKNQVVTLEMLVEAGADINKPDMVSGLLQCRGCAQGGQVGIE